MAVWPICMRSLSACTPGAEAWPDADSPQRAFKDESAYRIIPSRYPTICLYEDVANADELEAVWAIEALTNDRLREEAGELTRVPKADWLVGLAGGSHVMAAFTHLNPEGPASPPAILAVITAPQPRHRHQGDGLPPRARIRLHP